MYLSGSSKFHELINKRNYFLVFFGILSFLILGCNNKEDKKFGTADAESVWLDYQVTAKEGNDNLTIFLQYKDGGKNGDAVPMDKVMVDEEELTSDSTKWTGVFYELHKPIAEYDGKHSITFNSGDNEFKEDFNFHPVILATGVADTVKRGDLIFNLDGLEEKDKVRVIMIDTSFINNGINKVDSVMYGRLVINENRLKSLANGPVQLELIREFERPIMNGTKRRGRLLITYSLKREFFLMD